jgi:hypothetical protein
VPALSANRLPERRLETFGCNPGEQRMASQFWDQETDRSERNKILRLVFEFVNPTPWLSPDRGALACLPDREGNKLVGEYRLVSASGLLLAKIAYGELAEVHVLEQTRGRP